MSTINDFNISEKDIIQFYNNTLIKNNIHIVELTTLFDLNMSNKDLFPNINLGKTENNWQKYIIAWINKYLTANSNPPSSKRSLPSTSPYDPAINTLVGHTLNLQAAQLTSIELAHKLSMQAENIIGGLLEEYISTNIRQSGWIWCKGETVRSVDFYNPNTNCLLQIKNKFNTENSSSSAIRNNTSIKKWNRIGKRTVNGQVFADFKWPELNNIIFSNTNLNIPILSEEGFQQFLINVIAKNPELLYKL